VLLVIGHQAMTPSDRVAEGPLWASSSPRPIVPQVLWETGGWSADGRHVSCAAAASHAEPTCRPRGLLGMAPV